MKNILLEVCCGSADDVIEAYQAGADRVELNSDLFHGGLTPTVGTLRVVKRETDIPVMTMVRPREGGFCYTEAEYRVCLEDAELLIENGADGLVFGFLTAEGGNHADPDQRTGSGCQRCSGHRARDDRLCRRQNPDSSRRGHYPAESPARGGGNRRTSAARCGSPKRSGSFHSEQPLHLLWRVPVSAGGPVPDHRRHGDRKNESVPVTAERWQNASSGASPGMAGQDILFV